MQKTEIKLPAIKLVGIITRTNNSDEMLQRNAKIGPIVQAYFQQELAKKIHARKNPGTTFSVFTNYESDFNGNYTYFIGEEVLNFDEIEEGFRTLIIPSQTYTKFTNGPGSMPEVCIEMWRNIWRMSNADLGGSRSYIADFEIYDERSKDPQNTTLDIYIGIKK